MTAPGQSRRFGDVCDMSALPPTTAVTMQCRERRKGANSGHGAYDFFAAACLATSRACSMKISATGLSVRVFRVTTPIEAQANGSATGNTLSSERLVGNRKADLEK